MQTTGGLLVFGVMGMAAPAMAQCLKDRARELSQGCGQALSNVGVQ